MAQENIFENAEVIGAVGASASTAKVVQKLADGRLSIGTFFVKDGKGTPKSGGIVLTAEQFEALAAQVKKGAVVDLSTVVLPDSKPRARKLTAAENMQATITAGIAEGVQQALAALGVSAPVTNGKATVKS